MEEKLLTEIRDLLAEMRDFMKDEKAAREKAWQEASVKMAEQKEAMSQMISGLMPQRRG
jgi:hypothetical protein